MWNPFRKLRLRRKLGTVSNVGIDIGTSTIKVLQLSATAEGRKTTLETYGQLASYGHIRRFNDAIQADGFRFFEKHAVRLLDTLLDRAGVTTSDVVFSVPVFSTFVTTIRLPEMDPEEMKSAVPLQARQYVPSPLDEVQLNWLVVGYERKKEPSDIGLGSGGGEEGWSSRMMRVLITAAPKNVIDQYVAVADELGLNLQAIELESIALTRSSVEDTTKTTLLLDIGARSTDVTLVDHGAVQLSHNVDAAGEGLTKMVVNSKEETFLEAERTKRAKPFADEKGRIRKEFEGVAKQIVREAQRAAEEYQEQTGRPIQNIVLAGGTVILDGVDRFFQAMFPNTTVIKGNPWKGIATPDVLTPVLNDMAPAYGVAVGLALRPLKQRKPVNMREENPAPAATASSISSSSDSASEAARKSVQALSQ